MHEWKWKKAEQYIVHFLDKCGERLCDWVEYLSRCFCTVWIKRVGDFPLCVWSVWERSRKCVQTCIKSNEIRISHYTYLNDTITDLKRIWHCRLLNNMSLLLTKVTFVKTVTFVDKSNFCWQKQLLSRFLQNAFVGQIWLFSKTTIWLRVL